MALNQLKEKKGWRQKNYGKISDQTKRSWPKMEKWQNGKSFRASHNLGALPFRCIAGGEPKTFTISTFLPNVVFSNYFIF